MSNIDDNNYNLTEKVNILFFFFLNVPNTLESKLWYLEPDTPPYVDYTFGDDILIKSIPNFSTINWVDVTNDSVNLNDNDFATQATGTTSDVQEDSNGIIRRYNRLILDSIPNSNNNSYYKLDQNDPPNNVLSNAIVDLNYPKILSNQNNITSNSDSPTELEPGSTKGNWIFDKKTGIIFFSDYKSEYCDNSTNKPVLTFYKYIGPKGISNIVSSNAVIGSDLSLANLDISNSLRFVKDTSFITIIAPSDLSASYTLKLPKAQGISGNILALDGSQQLIFTNQNVNSNGNGQNIINNVKCKTSFTDSSYLKTDPSNYDLSNIFFHTITPSKTNAQIFVNFNFSYKCSYAFRERINIYIYRNNNLIQSDEYLGSKNFTGGFIGNFSSSFIDTPNTTEQLKYYIKFKLENNESEEPQGIYKFNSITLIEY